MGQANSHSVLGIVGGRLALELCRHKHVASGVILTRFCCCEGRDPRGGALRVPRPSIISLLGLS